MPSKQKNITQQSFKLPNFGKEKQTNNQQTRNKKINPGKHFYSFSKVNKNNCSRYHTEKRS